MISHEMETQRPKTLLLQRGDPIPVDKILKRSHSDCGTHVIFPDSKIEIGWDCLEEGPPGSSWMSQDFVPHLRNLGEWRAFIIGGKVLYVIHTRYNIEKSVWTSTVVHDYYTLHEIE